MLVTGVAVLAACFALLLWTPIDLDLDASRDPKLQMRFRVSWLFGLVTKELQPGDVGPERAPEETTAVTAATPTKNRAPQGGLSRAYRVMRSRGFLPGVVRLFRRIVTGIELRRAELRARAGFDDPADTGRLLAVLFPLSHYLQSASPFDVEIEPDFASEVFFFRLRGAVRVVPSRIVGPVVIFALSPTTVRAVLAARG